MTEHRTVLAGVAGGAFGTSVPTYMTNSCAAESYTVDPTNSSIAFEARHLVVNCTFMLHRRDFGLSWNEHLDDGGRVVANNVRVTASVEAIRAD